MMIDILKIDTLILLQGVLCDIQKFRPFIDRGRDTDISKCKSIFYYMLILDQREIHCFCSLKYNLRLLSTILHFLLQR